MNKKKQKKLWRIFLRSYTRTAITIVGVFGIVGLLHPGFFSYGMRHLTTALAEDLNVIGFVLPEPSIPMVTNELSCNPLNLSLALDLDWSTDSGGGTFTYDIERNGLPLVSGLPSTATSYLDTNMTIATTYTYIVRANGPMGPGFADSAPVTLTTPYDCNGLTPPIVAITMFNGRPLESYGKDVTRYTTTKRRPTLVGTSNIPFAQIRIVIDDKTKLVAYTDANINGYWEWTPTPRLNYERSVMQITATDPLNSNRYSETSLEYQIKRDAEAGSDEGGDNENDNTGSVPNTSGTSSNPAATDIAIDFSLERSSQNYQQGEVLKTRLVPDNIPTQKTERVTSIRYRLSDSRGNSITSFTREEFLRNGEVIENGIEIPAFVQPGRYKVGVDLVFEGVLYSLEKDITVMPIPVIRLGSGRDITYDEFIWNLGLISFIVLTTLLIWLFFVFYEYWLFMRGRLYVDEYDFPKVGLISRL